MPKTNVLPSKKMRRIGFTQHVEGKWYLCRQVLPHSTTFNLTVDKETGTYGTVVLCEYTGQPEMYGRMNTPYRKLAKAQIDVILYELRQQGLEIKFDHAEYGYEEEAIEEKVKLRGEIMHLKRTLNEALQALAEWDDVWLALNTTVTLGRSKAEQSLEKVNRMNKLIESLTYEAENIPKG